jgi:hypothetical protein
MLKKLSDFSLKGTVKYFSENIVKNDTLQSNTSITMTYYFKQNGILYKKMKSIKKNGNEQSESYNYHYDSAMNLVKEIKRSNIKTKKGQMVYDETIRIFNNKKITKETIYSASKLLSEKTFKYNKNNRCTVIYEISAATFKHIPIMDNAFRINRSEEDNFDKIQNEYLENITWFDENGHVILERKYNRSGILYSENNYIYNKKGDLIEKNIINKEKNIFAKVITEYYDKKRQIEKKEFDHKGNLLSEEISKYNKNGNELEKIEYNYHESAISVQMTLYHYNKNEQLAEIVFLTTDQNNNSKEEKIKFNTPPNQKNIFNLIEEPEDKIKYDYDTFDNWVTRKIFTLNKSKKLILNTTTSRIIEYY